eukprot:6247298-Pyramimonas_sp.AAC.1
MAKMPKELARLEAELSSQGYQSWVKIHPISIGRGVAAPTSGLNLRLGLRNSGSFDRLGRTTPFLQVTTEVAYMVTTSL